MMRWLMAIAVMALSVAADRRNVFTPDTDTHFKFSAPASLEEWKARKAKLREQILLAAGLSPMPEKTPLNPVVTGRIEHEDYAIERVAIETMPGYWLGGNLYLPRGRRAKFPAVLHPHGHWNYGRLEHQPLYSAQTLGVNLARSGFVVFAYDMVGYNDTAQTPHDFSNHMFQMWSFTPLGLQQWNSIRALDFLAARPDVDTARIAITGASGGGTQSFLLAATDDRIAVSAPVNMVSGIMQGGCVCENAPGLRIGTNNIETSALFAPKPQLIVAATGDWTRNVPVEEFPAVQSVYRLYGAESNVEAVRFDAPHNYHKESREAVYEFLRKHLKPQMEPFKERGARIEKLQDMLVWYGHKMPAHARTFEQLFAQWKTMAERQTASMDTAALRRRFALTFGMDGAVKPSIRDGYLSGAGGELIPAKFIEGAAPYALVLDPNGIEAAEKTPEFETLKASGRGILLIDAFQTASAKADRNRGHRHFLTFNHGDTAGRAADTALAMLWLQQKKAGTVQVLAEGRARYWALFAAAATGVPVKLGFDTAALKQDAEGLEDEFFVPGIMRAGGVAAAISAVNAASAVR